MMKTITFSCDEGTCTGPVIKTLFVAVPISGVPLESNGSLYIKVGAGCGDCCIISFLYCSACFLPQKSWTRPFSTKHGLVQPGNLHWPGTLGSPLTGTPDVLGGWGMLGTPGPAPDGLDGRILVTVDAGLDTIKDVVQ